MEEFTLGKHLKDPQRQIITRNGDPVRIICTDFKNRDFKLIGLVTEFNEETIHIFDNKGRTTYNSCTPYDLYFAPEKRL